MGSHRRRLVLSIELCELTALSLRRSVVTNLVAYLTSGIEFQVECNRELRDRTCSTREVSRSKDKEEWAVCSLLRNLLALCHMPNIHTSRETHRKNSLCSGHNQRTESYIALLQQKRARPEVSC